MSIFFNLKLMRRQEDAGLVTDGYHTFDELCCLTSGLSKVFMGYTNLGNTKMESGVLERSTNGLLCARNYLRGL